MAKQFVSLAHVGLNIFVPVDTFEKRNKFGRVDVRIVPVGGMGEAWVNEKRLTTAKKTLRSNR